MNSRPSIALNDLICLLEVARIALSHKQFRLILGDEMDLSDEVLEELLATVTKATT